MSTGLDQLATASSLTDTLKEIQESMQVLREDINHLKPSGLGPPSQEQYTTRHGIMIRTLPRES